MQVSVSIKFVPLSHNIIKKLIRCIHDKCFFFFFKNEKAIKERKYMNKYVHINMKPEVKLCYVSMRVQFNNLFEYTYIYAHTKILVKHKLSRQK